MKHLALVITFLLVAGCASPPATARRASVQVDSVSYTVQLPEGALEAVLAVATDAGVAWVTPQVETGEGVHKHPATAAVLRLTPIRKDGGHLEPGSRELFTFPLIIPREGAGEALYVRVDKLAPAGDWVAVMLHFQLPGAANGRGRLDAVNLRTGRHMIITEARFNGGQHFYWWAESGRVHWEQQSLNSAGDSVVAASKAMDLDTGQVSDVPSDATQPVPQVSERKFVVQVKALPAGADPMVPASDWPAVPEVLVWVRGGRIVARADSTGRAEIALPFGEHIVVASPEIDTGFKQSRQWVSITPASPDVLTLVVSADRELTLKDGHEVPTPPFHPAPDVVDVIKPMGPVVRQIHALRYAHSVWQVGHGHGPYAPEPFYVWTRSSADSPGIGTYLLNGGQGWSTFYACPRPLGIMEITDVGTKGRVIYFSSSSGVTGSFHLESLVWTFSD